MKKIFLTALCALCAAIMADAQTRVTIFGDSYSTFEGYLTPSTNESWYFTPESSHRHKGNDVTKVEQTWWWQVIDQMGWQLEMNNSYSGSTVGYFGYQNENYQPRSFNTRVENLGEPDIILSCCITNDSWTGEKLGEYKYANWTENDMWYFRPAMARLCSMLRQNYPMAKTYIILNTELRQDMCESLHVICRHYGLPVIVLHDIDKQVGHPSIAGHRAIAEQVVKYLKEEKR
ncbi:MAG: SGNH/GDSL hydrolase family protein [Bacteroidales bacterium]|nr:SGNH/GDSL hydrolase family protein [Bacteroidales bacterium]